MKSINEEYLDYILSEIGLLNEYDLYEAGISFDEYDNPSDEVIEKLENYRDKISKKN